MVDYLRDRDFLMKLNAERLQYKYVRLQVLDFDENPTGTIEGKCTAGTINVSNQSQMRRTGSITFIVEENTTYDFASVNNLLNLNTKIKVWIGLENHIDTSYDDMIWFPQGVFVITDLSIQNSLQGLVVNLNIKDKMCLLNGECGGTLPASVTFSTYNQQNADGSISIIDNPILDIIHTLVVNFGGENYDKIAVNDISKRIKQLCRWTGSMTLYVDTTNGIYTTKKPSNGYDPSNTTTWGTWRNYEAGENIGYRYVDFVYPTGDTNTGLVSSIGDTVVTVLNKLIEKIGNYEFFYDINGNFIWQEKKNYLNTTYDETHIMIEKKTNSDGSTSWDYSTDTTTNYYTWGLNSSIINNKNYMVSFNTSSYPQYNFTQGNNIISSYTNKLNYANIRNDYQIWGKNGDNSAIHYHLAVKSKPNKPYIDSTTGEPCYKARYIIPYRDANGTPTGMVRLALKDSHEQNGYESGALKRIPQDWREEIYYEGLETIEKGQRPDVITQEILDLFDSSYNMFEQKFKITRTNPNSLSYYIDFLEPYGPMSDYSVNGINLKTYTMQNDNIVRMYDVEAPDYILIADTESISPNEEEQYIYNDDGTPIISGKEVMLRRAKLSGDTPAFISDSLKSKIYENIVGYSAQEYARDLLYQHTGYAESITLETTPIFHLEPNTTIQVYDKDSGISGDYVIDSFSIDLSNSGTMSIEATKSLKRI